MQCTGYKGSEKSRQAVPWVEIDVLLMKNLILIEGQTVKLLFPPPISLFVSCHGALLDTETEPAGRVEVGDRTSIYFDITPKLLIKHLKA